MFNKVIWCLPSLRKTGCSSRVSLYSKMFWKQNLFSASSMDCQHEGWPINTHPGALAAEQESLSTFKWLPPLWAALLREAKYSAARLSSQWLCFPRLIFLSQGLWWKSCSGQEQGSFRLPPALASFPRINPHPKAFWNPKKDLSLAVTLRVSQSHWRRGVCYSRQHWLPLRIANYYF